MNPNYQKILNYLEGKSYPVSTRLIARNVVYKEQYDKDDEFFKGRAFVQPGRGAVSGTYYFLNKLQKEGKIKQCNRGTWILNKV